MSWWRGIGRTLANSAGSITRLLVTRRRAYYLVTVSLPTNEWAAGRLAGRMILAERRKRDLTPEFDRRWQAAFWRTIREKNSE